MAIGVQLPPQHKRHQGRALAQRTRPHAAARGYDYKWQKYRLWFLSQVECSICGRNHALCEECSKRGIYVVATVADHVIPHRGNRQLFEDHDNHQGLCDPCHGVKSKSERIG